MLTRARHAWNVLRGIGDAHWSAEQINQISYEMAEGIIVEIGQTLVELGCCHGHDMKSTPPMFYREAILCAMKKTRDERDVDWERAVREVRGDDQLGRFVVRQGMVCDEILKRMGRT